MAKNERERSQRERAPARRDMRKPLPPSPPERHPGLKPEQAAPRYEDLEVRERENRR